MAKWVSLIVKARRARLHLFVPTQYAIQLQLLGGIWIIQTLPAVMLGALYPLVQRLGAARRLGGRDLWRHLHGGLAELSPTYPLVFAGYTFPGYTAFYTLLLNLAIVVVLTPVFNLASRPVDETLAADYHG